MNRIRLENIFSELTIALASYDYERKDVRLLRELCDEVLCYKQIEEELGIDLVTMFKALEDGAWFKIGNRFYTDRPNLIRDIRQFTLQVPYHGFVNVKDYGKTWALTREELE